MNKVIKVKFKWLLLLIVATGSLVLGIDELENVISGNRSLIDDTIGVFAFGIIGMAAWYYAWQQITKENKDEHTTR